MARPQLLIGFDFEDWHQLVHRRLGLPNWDAPHGAFERQVDAVLGVLDELEATATFFVLGMTAKNYPRAVAELVRRGHEIACHGHAHVQVFRQTRDQFRSDVAAAVETIGELADTRPVGFRAPVFSVTRETSWAFDVLAELGFAWDSSLHDSPRLRRRLGAIPETPFRIRTAAGSELWEFPIAVWHAGRMTVPVGGGSYWRVLPWRVLERGLVRRERAAAGAALYFHPYEFDAEPLRAELSGPVGVPQRARALQRAARASPLRARIPLNLRRLSRHFRLTSYRDAFKELTASSDGGPRTLSREGVLV